MVAVAVVKGSRCGLRGEGYVVLGLGGLGFRGLGFRGLGLHSRRVLSSFMLERLGLRRSLKEQIPARFSVRSTRATMAFDSHKHETDVRDWICSC